MFLAKDILLLVLCCALLVDLASAGANAIEGKNTLVLQ